MIGAIAAAAAAGLAGYSVLYEAFAVRLSRVRVLCPRLPKAFNGYRVLQLSDLHMSQMGRRERSMAKLVRDLAPDILVLTGDLTQDDVSARMLAEVVESAGSRDGCFAISGNSDLRHPENWSGVRRVLLERGIRMLENEHVVLSRGGEQLVLAGVEDPHTMQDDLKAALSGAPEGAFVLLLAHSPAIVVPAVEAGVDLVLSGHTHGGQLVFPLVGPLLTRSGHGKEISSGLYDTDKLRKTLEVDPGETQIYISRGLGASFVPARLLCPPEVTLLELHNSSVG